MFAHPVYNKKMQYNIKYPPYPLLTFVENIFITQKIRRILFQNLSDVRLAALQRSVLRIIAAASHRKPLGIIADIPSFLFKVKVILRSLWSFLFGWTSHAHPSKYAKSSSVKTSLSARCSSFRNKTKNSRFIESIIPIKLESL